MERRAVVAAAVSLGLAVGVIFCAALALLAGPLAAWASDGTATGSAASRTLTGLIMMLALIHLVDGPASAAGGVLRGLKRARAPMAYLLVGYWGIGAPLGILLAERGGLGATGLWIGLTVGAVISGLATLAHVLRTHDA